MTVIRFDPFRDPLERLLSMAATGTRAPLGMPMDVYRAGDGSYHVEADLPGVDPDSVEVTVEHSTLTIRAERTPHYGESEQVIVAERPQGSFTRQLSLGEGVDSENLTAAYADGVLHLTIPVSPKTQARRVEITHAPGGSRTISGRTAEQGEAPAGGTGGGLNIRPVRPAPATTAYGLVQAWDRQRTTSWRQPDGARMACCRRTAIPGIAAPRRDRCPKPAQAHRIAGVEVLRASTLPRKSCR
jgi:HSP20 family protein